MSGDLESPVPNDSQNPVRREVVEAGAGCGKTYSLVSRYIEALGYDPETGKRTAGLKADRSPSKILALTFTEDAAEEMKERVLARLQSFGLQELAMQVFEEGRISTFHGFCYRALRPFLKDLGYADGAQLLPGRIVRERRLRYLFGALDSYPRQLEILSLLSTTDVCGLGVDLWFKVLENSQASLAEIRRELGVFKTHLDRTRRALAQGTDEIFSAIPEARNPEKPNWVQNVSQLLAEPHRLGEIEISFIGGPRKIKEEFAELVEVAKSFRELLKELGPAALDPAALDREISAYGEIFAFFEYVLPKSPKWLDFEALEFEFLRLLQKLSTDEVSEKIGVAEILLVDEFQDTSPDQLAILEKISRPSSEWYFVGDPKQSIYSFRKADVSIFLELKKRVHGLTLETNRRSDPALLQALNAMAAHFLTSGPYEHRTPPQNLKPHLSEDHFAKPVVIKHHTEGSLPDFAELSADITANAQQFPEATHGVLFMTWTKLFDFGRWLSKRGIPFEIAGREKHLEHMLTLLFSDYLSWVAKPELGAPYFSLQRWWREARLVDPQRWADTTDSKTQHLALFGNGGPFDSWQRHLQFFCDLIAAKKWRGGAAWTASMEKLLTDLETVGLHEVYALDDLSRFLGRDPSTLEADISGFESVIRGPSQKLRLLTVHGSKGLEFDCVYLPQLYSRPHQQRSSSLDDGEALGLNLSLFDERGLKVPSLHFRASMREKLLREDAEKLRLFYVAITRAKRRLHLYVPPAPKSASEVDGLELLGLPRKQRSAWSGLLQSFWSRADEGVRAALDWIPAPDDDGNEDAEPKAPQERIWLYPQIDEPLMRDSVYFRGGVRRYLEMQEPAASIDSTAPPSSTNSVAPARNSKDGAGQAGDVHEPRIDLSSAELGILFHELMERWNGKSESLDALTRGHDHGELLKSAARAVRALSSLEPYFDCLTQNPDRVFRESEILLQGDTYLLTGIADAFWYDEQSGVNILDWKTSFYLGGFSDAEKMRRILDQLKLYGAAFRSVAQSCRVIAVGVELKGNTKTRVILDQKLF